MNTEDNGLSKISLSGNVARDWWWQ